MPIGPDSTVIFSWGPVTVNATLLYTWLVMVLLTVISGLVTRRLSTGPEISRWQNFLETIVGTMRDQIAEIHRKNPRRYLPFLGTLFLFISLANLLAFIPYYQPPTASLSTTAALAVCVFFAVPIFGIAEQGIKNYLRRYIRPTVFMLPFHVIGEFSRTLALAVRLFGNIMSGTMIVAILISVVPFFVPVIMSALGLLIGQIQAYIFAVLAAVYIASAARTRRQEDQEDEGEPGGSDYVPV